MRHAEEQSDEASILKLVTELTMCRFRDGSFTAVRFRMTMERREIRNITKTQRRKEMRMKNKILGGAAMLMAAFSLSEASATSCAVPPTCAQLGYTMKKTDCGDVPIMRCPFAVSDDNQVYCEGTGKEAALPILYGDGKVSKKLLLDKTPIGIVFDEEKKLAVALSGMKVRSQSWTNKKYDIPNLENCVGEGTNDDSLVLSCAVDGRANTDKILACGSGCGGTPAATAVNSYKPVGCSEAFCGQGKWFLPSMKELNDMYKINFAVNSSFTFLASLGKDIVVDPLGVSQCVWSSNEYDADKAWYLCFTNHYQNMYPKTSNFEVRPVVKY